MWWHKKFFEIRFYQYIFIVSNTIFWASGWGALAIGIWLYTQKNLYSNLAPTSYSAMSAAGLCTTVGAMVLIISFIGCIGNLIHSKCLLVTYFCFVLLLSMIQCMTGTISYLYQQTVRERAVANLRHTINATNGDTPRGISLWNTWIQMQYDLKCCGVDNYTDWFFYPRWRGKRFVPDSCCDPEKFDMNVSNATLNCGKDEQNQTYLFQQGCAKPFTDWLLQHLHIIGVSTLLFVVIEIFVLSSVLRLIVHLHKSERRNRCSRTKYKFDRAGVNNDGEASLTAVQEDASD